MRAAIGFADAPEKHSLAWLRPGFRHCFAALNDGAAWLLVDPLAHRLRVTLLPLDPDQELAPHWRAQGLYALTVPVADPPRRWRPGPFTCVETVKRLIGLRAPFVLTPWQLYCALERKDLRL